MTGDHPAALRASPFRPLRLQKGLDALVPYVVQVLNLAHSELRPVPLVDGGQRFTRKGRALIAVSDLVPAEQIAALLQERTGLVPGPAPDTVHHSDALALNVVCDCEIRCAHVAVHSARRD